MCNNKSSNSLCSKGSLYMVKPDFAIGIQARLGSTRLPGKVLFPLGNSTYTSLSLMVKRIRSNPNLCDIPIILLTTKSECDTAIVNLAKRLKLPFIQGSVEDVLGRYADLATSTGALNIVRLTGDCPLIDPQEIVRLMALHKESKADYTTNTYPESPTPDGLDVEIISSETLLKSSCQASLPSEREHVTFHIASSTSFKTVRSPMATTTETYTRLTLDTSWDYQLISFIVDSLESPDSATTSQILKVYTDHNLGDLVSHIVRNSGWQTAFDADAKYLDKSQKNVMNS